MIMSILGLQTVFSSAVLISGWHQRNDGQCCNICSGHTLYHYTWTHIISSINNLAMIIFKRLIIIAKYKLLLTGDSNMVSDQNFTSLTIIS